MHCYCINHSFQMKPFIRQNELLLQLPFGQSQVTDVYRAPANTTLQMTVVNQGENPIYWVLRGGRGLLAIARGAVAGERQFSGKFRVASDMGITPETEYSLSLSCGVSPMLSSCAGFAQITPA